MYDIHKVIDLGSSEKELPLVHRADDEHAKAIRTMLCQVAPVT